MFNTQEIIASLYGALRLMFFDRRGAFFFTPSKATARSSFVAPVLGCLLLTFILSFKNDDTSTGLSGIQFSFAYIAGFLFGLGSFYLIAHLFLETVYANHILLFPRLVTAFNWASFIQCLFFCLPVLANICGILTDSAATAFLITLAMVFFNYRWFVIRHTLDIHWAWSVALVIVSLSLENLFTILSFSTISGFIKT